MKLSLLATLKKVVVALPLLLLISMIQVPTTVFADNASIGAACGGLEQLPDGSCGNNGSTAINIASKGVQLLSIVAGIITVLMIIVAGFQYITSAGDAGRVGKAKSALIYATIGLFVVSLSQFLVHVVLSAAN